jgi:protein-S-isoprenylcysteine O-methyltransferase Ste14
MTRDHAEGKQRSDLTGEHPLGHAVQIILALMFFTCWGVDTFLLHYTTQLNDDVPLLVRLPAGLALLAVAGLLSIKAHAMVFGEKRDVPCVIRTGVFGLVRHPMYLSELLLYLGLIVLSLSLAAAAVWVLAVLFLHHISRYEERLLLDRFGDDYARYRREVPMWIPRLKIKA